MDTFHILTDINCVRNNICQIESGMRKNIFFICDTLRDLVAFVRFEKREKHPWRSVKLYKWQQIAQRTTYTTKLVLLLFDQSENK